MKSIDPLCDLAEEVLEVIKDSYPDGINVIQHSSASKTGLALISLVSKTGFLSNAIFDLAETDNLYCINILFRSMIEHYLKSQYLLTRYVSEKSDSVGSEYFEFCDLIEQADLIAARNRVAKLLDPNSKQAMPFDLIREGKPQLSKFSNADIQRNAGRFKHRRIIEFLLEHVYRNRSLHENNFLLGMITRYSELSGFVHGGPSGDRYVQSATGEGRDKESFELAQSALLMATHVKYAVYVVLLSIDGRFEKPCGELSRMLRSIVRVAAT